VIYEGQVVLFRFPQTDQAAGKLRPAVVLRKLPGPYDDWLVCMISSQLAQAVPGFDETIAHADTDFGPSGLKVPSVVRICRLAVVERRALLGAIGQIAAVRLARMQRTLARWLGGA